MHCDSSYAVFATEAGNRWPPDYSPLRKFQRVFGDLRARSGCWV